MAETAIKRSMNAGEWTMLLLLSVLWGGSFFFNAVYVGALPPFTLVFLRVLFAAIILNVVVKALGMTMPRRADIWIAFLAMGFLNNAVPFSLIVWGQGHIASGLAAILNATTPLWTVVVAHFLTTDEKMTGNRLLGVVIGFVGVIVMIGADSLKGLGDNVVAQLAVLGAALSYAFAGVFGRRFKRMGLEPMQTATGQVSASTLIMLPVVLLVDQPWTYAMPGIRVWLAVLGVAALSTALSYVLYFRILATAGATNLLLVTFLIPVSAIVLGSLVLDEHLEPRHFVGMAFIGAGLAAIDGRLLRLGKRSMSGFVDSGKEV